MGGVLMRLLPLTHLPPATVSAALWALSRPDAGEQDTRFYCGWITHPQTGQHALTLAETDTQPIHPNADPAIDALVSALRPIVGDTQADALHATLTAAKGTRLSVVNALPPALQAALITQEQANADGWFPENEIELEAAE